MREEPLAKAKPFDIPKPAVWEAYQRVKANRGAAGVDDQSIEAFDQDAKNNLFQAMEPTVIGQLLSSAGKAGSDQEEQWRFEAVRNPNGLRPHCARRGEGVPGTRIGKVFPLGFLWVSAWQVGTRGRGRGAAAMLAL